MVCVLIHYNEIGLKGNNRGDFENQLVRNIKTITGEERVEKLPGRIVLYPEKTTEQQLSEKLCKVFGIAWFAFCTACPADFEEIKRLVEQAAAGKVNGRTFKIEGHRSYNQFPLSSTELNVKLGDLVRQKFGGIVSLSNPDETIFVEVAEEQAFVFTKRFQGPGGLPVGSSGRVLCLLSGGIDSPVSAWMMMKRGCIVDFLHVHALRSNEEVKNSKVFSLYKTMLSYSPLSKLYTVPFHEFDVQVQNVPEKFHLIMFKQFLLSVAEGFSNKIRASAIVTGDCLAQVASQTLESLVSIETSSIPVFRPLVGFDKLEIITLAKKIGTYETSICGYKDCCAIVAKHPATRPSQSEVKKFSEQMQLEKIVEKTLENVGLLG